MYVGRIYVDGFKNLDNTCVNLDKGINIIWGNNAQGKTNFIEAIWLCTGCHSFRGTKEKDWIGFNKNASDIKINFQAHSRMQQIEMILPRDTLKKNTLLNCIPVNSMAELFNTFSCILFTPDHLDLVKGAPEKRRDFLDMAVSQIRRGYLNALNTYNDALYQRNTLLKNYGGDMSKYDKDQIEAWDMQIANAGAYMSIYRTFYCENLKKYIGISYDRLTSGKEKISLEYESTVFGKDIKPIISNEYHHDRTDYYMKKLGESAEDDVRMGYTTIGVHRDDFTICIDGHPVRVFGSQGQARSAAIVLKLAQAEIFNDTYKEYPVMLFDDVMSELDESRQDFILNSIENMQVLITCCDKNIICSKKKTKDIEILKGYAFEPGEKKKFLRPDGTWRNGRR